MQCTIRLNSVVKYVIDDARARERTFNVITHPTCPPEGRATPSRLHLTPPDPYNGSVLCPSLVNRMNSNQSYNVADLSADVLLAGGNVAL